jgi:hypothetical protein
MTLHSGAASPVDTPHVAGTAMSRQPGLRDRSPAPATQGPRRTGPPQLSRHLPGQELRLVVPTPHLP